MQLTKSTKEQLYTNTEYIIHTIYYLCGGKVLHAQLIALLEEMSYPNKSTTKIKSDILELIKGGFIKKKQVLATNSNMLILTAYPLSQILAISSRDVSEIAVSKKSILESICRTEYLISLLHAFRKKNKLNTTFEVTTVQAVMNYRNSTLCYPLKDINKYMDNIMMLRSKP